MHFWDINTISWAFDMVAVGRCKVRFEIISLLEQRCRPNRSRWTKMFDRCKWNCVNWFLTHFVLVITNHPKRICTEIELFSLCHWKTDSPDILADRSQPHWLQCESKLRFSNFKIIFFKLGNDGRTPNLRDVTRCSSIRNFILYCDWRNSGSDWLEKFV